jgi:hypothetical protein
MGTATPGTATDPLAGGYENNLRRLPMNNINEADTVTLIVSITAGINVNTATTGSTPSSLVASWPIDDIAAGTGDATHLAVPRNAEFKL